ncbi:MAG TPA: 4Fe-4S binding protein [Thermoplasmataceae archaeon]|nr:4Fe-4S binding protein [Thermoplasmataceae archaeon]
MVLVPVTQKGSRENRTDSWRIQTPRIDYSTCIRCMICWKFCPDNAITVSESNALEAPSERIGKLEAPEIDLEHCKGCGICAYECPEDSIKMSLEGSMSQ